jgi:hypothetical protein
VIDYLQAMKAMDGYFEKVEGVRIRGRIRMRREGKKNRYAPWIMEMEAILWLVWGAVL